MANNIKTFVISYDKKLSVLENFVRELVECDNLLEQHSSQLSKITTYHLKLKRNFLRSTLTAIDGVERELEEVEEIEENKKYIKKEGIENEI